MRLVWKGSVVVAIGASAVAAAVWGVAATLKHAAGRPAQQAAAPIPDYGLLPDFSLVDQAGQPLRRSDLLGSVWIADFIFTRCAGQCPMMTAQVQRLQHVLSRESDIRFVSFSVDPGYDTPERLAAYAQRSGADETSWRFVTGEPEAILRLAREGFRLSVSEEGSEREPITHSIRLALVDQRGHVRGYYDATDEQAMTRLRDDVHQLGQVRG